MPSESGKPAVIGSALAAEDRVLRAQIAAAEEVGEIARMREEQDLLRSILSDVQGTRIYRVLRATGRWGSVARGLRRANLA